MQRDALLGDLGRAVKMQVVSTSSGTGGWRVALRPPRPPVRLTQLRRLFIAALSAPRFRWRCTGNHLRCCSCIPQNQLGNASTLSAPRYRLRCTGTCPQRASRRCRRPSTSSGRPSRCKGDVICQSIPSSQSCIHSSSQSCTSVPHASGGDPSSCTIQPHQAQHPPRWTHPVSNHIRPAVM